MKWTIPNGFEELPEVVNRNLYTEELSKMPVDKICRKCLNLSFEEVMQLFKNAIPYIPKDKMKGSGIDLGAGTGFLSVAALKTFSTIEKIYGVEIVSGYPSLIMPKVAKEILGKEFAKLKPVIGSFDNMELEDGSIDFAVEIHSLHHSHDLDVTLAEVNRVLKLGGLLVCFDRSHPDSLTDKQVEKMVNVKYSKEFLREHGYPVDKDFTRKENGEHEHRISEWKSFFERNKFKIKKVKFFGPAFNLKRFASAFLGQFPIGIGTKNRAALDYEFLKLKGGDNFKTFRRKYTMFICEKFA